MQTNLLPISITPENLGLIHLSCCVFSIYGHSLKIALQIDKHFYEPKGKIMNIFALKYNKVAEKSARSISKMLFSYGLDGTLDYFCNISVFSID